DLPAGAALLEDLPQAGPVDVFVGPDAPGADVERLEAAGVHVHAVPAGPRGLDLGHVLRVAWTLGARSILCEGGRGVAATFLREGRAQRLYLFVAPRTLGASAVPAFEDDADTLDWSRWEPAAPPARFGRDTLMVLDLQEASGGPGRRAATVGDASGCSPQSWSGAGRSVPSPTSSPRVASASNAGRPRGSARCGTPWRWTARASR